ncbi:MAG: hypothetical protein IPM49_18025 [Flavobacteriales bacterium]|nr:hypothetical protein [Flavobacteriales bacterium]
MFEHRSEPLASRGRFLRRQLRYVAWAAVFVGLSLAVGTWGYAGLGGLGPVDALLNAAMILSGMGPVDPMRTNAAKLFAAVYAVYSGVALLTTVAVLLAPVVHRMLHALHLGDEDRE